MKRRRSTLRKLRNEIGRRGEHASGVRVRLHFAGFERTLDSVPPNGNLQHHPGRLIPASELPARAPQKRVLPFAALSDSGREIPKFSHEASPARSLQRNRDCSQLRTGTQKLLPCRLFSRSHSALDRYLSLASSRNNLASRIGESRTLPLSRRPSFARADSGRRMVRIN